MHETLKYHIRGLSPLMLHNGQTANPLNPYSKGMKEITSKRKKTDADYEALALLEWEAGLYLNADRRVVFPSDNIEAALIEGAKKNKLGEVFKAAVLSEGEWLLDYDGPKDLDKMRKDPKFRDFRGVRVNNGRVMRCRPIFIPWSLKFEVQYLPDLLNPSQVTDALVNVGRIIGIGDFTPKYGRFEVVS